MFYANFVLAKKGPLARVWLAAHWEKKLSKAHVFETDLQSSVDSIISPKVKIALRTSGHLLLGVVRIYSRKAKYLLADCTEALIKIKMAFRPDVVDLPLDNQKAAVSAITLPEFQEWDAMMSNLGSFDITATINTNQCRVEEITMKDDLISSRFLSDDNFFGDTPFGETSEKEIMRDEVTLNESINMQADLSKTQIQDDDLNLKEKSTLSINQSNLELALEDDPMMGDGGFGAGEGLDFLEGFGLGEGVELTGLEDLDKQATLEALDVTLTSKDVEKEEVLKEIEDVLNEKPIDEPQPTETDADTDAVVPDQPTELPTGAETTLFSRDTEAFALEPVEVTVGKEKRKKRKRKLIVDEEKIIRNDQMKEQINNYDDIVKAAIVAPPTRVRMGLLDSSAKTLFQQPASVKSKRKRLNELYNRNLTFKIPDEIALPSSQEDEVQLEDPSEIMRDAAQMTGLPEITNEMTEIEKTADDEEPLEEFAQPEMDIDMEVRAEEELNEEELQVPPPFELETNDKTVEDISVSAFMKEVDEEVEGDTDKQGELHDKRWTKRTQQTLHMLEKGLKKKIRVNFKDLTKKCNRKQAAYRFYTLLILNKEKAIKVEQDGLFADIWINRGEKFNAHV